MFEFTLNNFQSEAGSRGGHMPTSNTSVINVDMIDDGGALCGGEVGPCHMSNESFNLSNSNLGTDYATNFTLTQTVILGLLAGSTSVVTISGNLVVILSFIVERSIRQPSNYFIASLAVSDLFIGSISMPFYTVYLLSGKYWPLGQILCDLWLSIDYTVCLSSIYTVFCITIDRFCSVQIPARYRNWRTERKVLTIICVTWVVPVLVFFTSINGWQHFVNERTVPDGMCYVQYLEEPIFNLCLQFGYFWITLTVMCSLYAGIYRVALRLQRQAEEKHQRRVAMLASSAGAAAVSKTGPEMTQQQQSATAAATAVQYNSRQRKNGSNAIGGVEQRSESCNHIADVQPPTSSKSTKKNKHHHSQGRQLKKHKQRENDDDDDDQSSSFAFSSDVEEYYEDYKRSDRRTSVAVTAESAKRPKTSIKSSKKTRRRATRHTSPVVAVERAVEFIARQHRPSDEVHRPDIGIPTSIHNTADCSVGQADCFASADLPRPDAEASVSRGHRDHQCVFDAWKRPMPRHSPVWIRRQVGGPTGHRGNCNSGRSDLGPTPVDHVDDDNTGGRTTCGCHLPSSLTNVNCLSVRSPNIQDDITTGIGASVAAKPETTTVAQRLQDRGQTRRRLSASHRSTAEHHRKPFVLVAALHRLSQTRRERRGRGANDAVGTLSSAVPRTSKNENRARKALRTITIILGAFVICWTPWHVLSMIMGFCMPCVEPVIYDISYWLCYLNSPINPFCYAFANQQFKKTFLRIFRCDWRRT